MENLNGKDKSSTSIIPRRGRRCKGMSEISVFEKISEQQPKERTAVWMVGEQLKDIIRGEPHLQRIVLQDLENESMSIANCEKKIKAFADKHKTGNFSCVTPAEADRIIREFYGLSGGHTSLPPSGGSKVIDLSAFW